LNPEFAVDPTPARTGAIPYTATDADERTINSRARNSLAKHDHVEKLKLLNDIKLSDCPN